MAWEVSSHIRGGTVTTAATLEEYARVARALTDEASTLDGLAVSWTATGLEIRTKTTAIPCLVHRAAGLSPGPGHTAMSFANLHAEADRCAAWCRSIAERTRHLSDLLIRAHALYADAEAESRGFMDSIVQGATTFLPVHTGLGVGASALAGAFGPGRGDDTPRGIAALDSTSWAHHGFMRGLGVGAAPLNLFTARHGQVNAGAERIAGIARRMADNRQGDTLRVTRVHPKTPVLTASRSLPQALENLRTLDSERTYDGAGVTVPSRSGLDYATIAVQRYRRPDGSHSWLVVIPGTDGQPDSPFGWMQNVEAMSADPVRRRHADSVRLVKQAMAGAGIGPRDEVALVGHSQGGIVAAAIAADEGKRYAIKHVVTAGAPIAGHPIPSRTWVTSIEIEDELVAALDGADNPSSPSWLTVHGTVRRADAGSSPPFSASRVRGVGEQREMSHGLPFHQAAYRHAKELGSPGVRRHERHFQDLIAGELEETSYWQGRMSHDSQGR